jgi:hypothetical protein
MDTKKLMQMVGNNNQVQFVRYHDGQLWYVVAYTTGVLGLPMDGEYFEFPVPVSDIGTATFLAKDRAMLFMRYIRKHMEMLEEAKKQKDVPVG